MSIYTYCHLVNHILIDATTTGNSGMHGDLSILEAIVQKGQPAAALTSSGSDNYRLWSELASRGWMKKEDAPEGVYAFSVTEKGQLGLDRFVAMLNASRKDWQKRDSL